ncbi:MAG: hypothetical protein AAF360_10500 [Pseudomonadota bacterium]
MPNALAFIALFGWPIVVFVLFRRLSRPHAIVWSVLGGYLLLPTGTGVDLPLLPRMDKILLPSLIAALLCMLGLGASRALRRRPPPRRRLERAPQPPEETAVEAEPFVPNGWLPPSLIGKALIIAFIFTPFASVFTNETPLTYGPTFIKALELYDGFSFALTQAVVILPFLLGHRYLGGEDGQRAVLFGFVIGAVAYSAPMLAEIRFSPQLHTWVYGYFPHSFEQQVRGGGYRPVVFLKHGLAVAIFVAMALIAAAALWREASGALRTRLAMATAWFAILLVLCKSLGALVLGLPLAIAARVVNRRLALTGAALIAGAVLAYPMLRGADIVPTSALLSAANSVNEERADSLQTRLTNEDQLLARANLKPTFGWGGWGRSRVYDPVTGKDLTVADGRWIIVIGSGGWIGYLGEYGLLFLPVLALAAGYRRMRPSTATVGLAVMLAANVVDLIPNSSLTPVTWLLAGALFGRLSRERRQAGRRTARRTERRVDRRGGAGAPRRPDAGGVSVGGGGVGVGGRATGLRPTAAGESATLGRAAPRWTRNRPEANR